VTRRYKKVEQTRDFPRDLAFKRAMTRATFVVEYSENIVMDLAAGRYCVRVMSYDELREAAAVQAGVPLWVEVIGSVGWVVYYRKSVADRQRA
jgi:hypothetical protein